jgi:hypothetical protein
MKDTMSSSSSRPPPPHPILKKSRGPSTSGPRPTARFVSPHDSEDEAPKEDDTSSGGTATKGMQMRGPAKSAVKGEKKSTPTGRKFTASSAAKRHSRPVLARRPSSQSSVDTSTKGGSHATGSRTGTGGRPDSVEQSTTASLASPSSSTLVNSPGLSAKAAGKRPMEASPEKHRTTDRGILSSAQSRTPPVIVHHQREAAAAQGQKFELSGSSPARSDEAGRAVKMVRAETPRSHLRLGSPAQPTAPMMARSQSNIETQHHRPRELHSGRPLPQSMITPKSTPVTKKEADVTIQVQFDSESVKAQGGGGMARDLPDSIAIASRPSTSSLYTPTQPSPTPAPFLGRSKSQLTLLLEKMDQGKPKSSRSAKGKEHGS